MTTDIRGRQLVSLDSVAPDSDSFVLPDFPAIVDGNQVWVTAVLERTAIIEPAPGLPKQLVRRDRCLVDPRLLRISVSASRHAARRGREAARRNRQQQESAA